MLPLVLGVHPAIQTERQEKSGKGSRVRGVSYKPCFHFHPPPSCPSSPFLSCCSSHHTLVAYASLCLTLSPSRSSPICLARSSARWLPLARRSCCCVLWCPGCVVDHLYFHPRAIVAQSVTFVFFVDNPLSIHPSHSQQTSTIRRSANLQLKRHILLPAFVDRRRFVHSPCGHPVSPSRLDWFYNGMRQNR